MQNGTLEFGSKLIAFGFGDSLVGLTPSTGSGCLVVLSLA